ncbi:thymidine phosphorylase family protein [Marinospirillum alkaliphilum]|uniref:Putative thymidine phosphorylase n=1 Tax=Marinospirillum alkaliphilum DSM 21637 TaxID=1122209 RepID=A0A1K2A0A3_9GAMM|nr:thymidine phosphorylase family protein [Marinospirillum alkaliphilum]SFX79809.1 thymidine phosphorylase [Marinospirillum alkaliphilum DSM 21637]
MAVTQPSDGLAYPLKPVRLGIDTHQELVVYLRRNSHVCRSEGFTSSSRVQIRVGERWILATLSIIDNDQLLQPGEMGLSESAWKKLDPPPGSEAQVRHADPVLSLSHLRHKVYGHRLNQEQTQAIIDDIVAGRYSDVHLSSFVTACAGNSLDQDEIIALTTAMLKSGRKLDWGHQRVVDKHCVGGLAGNRTTPIVVAIVTACGGIMPKTSSRAITSPAGTADTMATMAPVNLDLKTLRKVVTEHGGCLAWGGSVNLSPADDVLIRVERMLDLDSEGQMVASVLSKKAAAGSHHVLIDIPIGPTAKVRSEEAADLLSRHLIETGKALGLDVKVVRTDGTQPVGRGIGPALEAKDLLAVLRNQPEAPQDLRERALFLAAELLEMAGLCEPGKGLQKATETLDSGAALKKFIAICDAQGGFTEPNMAPYQYNWQATKSGRITGIDNRQLSQLAKLAGAPEDPTAGVTLEVKLNTSIKPGQLLLTLHADSPGELQYAVDFLEAHPQMIEIS